MLDEPLGSLDRALRDALVGELRALFVQLGVTALVVTHDHDEAFALADRVIVMQAGRIEQSGPAHLVWQAPANAFVASFLGWNVTDAFGGRGAIRPEQLELSSPSGEVVAVVERTTFRRDRFVVGLRLPDGGHLDVAMAAGAPLPQLDERVGVTARPGALVALAD